jgi:hypothetical protein
LCEDHHGAAEGGRDGRRRERRSIRSRRAGHPEGDGYQRGGHDREERGAGQDQGRETRQGAGVTSDEQVVQGESGEEDDTDQEEQATRKNMLGPSS